MEIYCLCFHIFVHCADVQVSCIKHVDQYIPPLWVMCLESVAHLLVMLNFSSNFLIYCSVSTQFKGALLKAWPNFLRKSSPPSHMKDSEYQQLPVSLAPQLSNTTHELVDVDQEDYCTNKSGLINREKQKDPQPPQSHQLKIC